MRPCVPPLVASWVALGLRIWAPGDHGAVIVLWSASLPGFRMHRSQLTWRYADCREILHGLLPEPDLLPAQHGDYVGLWNGRLRDWRPGALCRFGWSHDCHCRYHRRGSRVMAGGDLWYACIPGV